MQCGVALNVESGPVKGPLVVNSVRWSLPVGLEPVSSPARSLQNEELNMHDKLPDPAPLTVPELQGMLQRHAGNPPVKKVIEQALSRRLREEVEVGR